MTALKTETISHEKPHGCRPCVKPGPVNTGRRGMSSLSEREPWN